MGLELEAFNANSNFAANIIIILKKSTKANEYVLEHFFYHMKSHLKVQVKSNFVTF